MVIWRYMIHKFQWTWMAIPHSPATWGKQEAMCWYLLSTWFPNWCMDVHRPKKSYHMGSDTFPYNLVGGVKPTRNKYICQLGSSTQHIYIFFFHKQWVITNHHHDYPEQLHNMFWHHLFVVENRHFWCWNWIGWSQACGSLTIFGVPGPFCLEKPCLLQGIPHGFWWIN